jgi:D-alanine-D-alanine ligase
MRIGVLLGGWSVERDVSLISGEAVIKAINELGHDAIAIDPNPDLRIFIDQIDQAKPDIIFNALHGRYGEDGRIPAVLDLLKIPYTHSGVLSSSLAMDKVVARRVFEGLRISVAKGGVFTPEEIKTGHVMPVPYVIKPIWDGSSLGVVIVNNDDDLKAWSHDPVFGKEYLVEDFIPGREVQVAVINGKAIGVIELCSHTKFYDYKAKYTAGSCTHLMPAPIPKDIEDYLLTQTQNVFKGINCRGIARADWRYDDISKDHRVILLEINTHPGFTNLSLMPEIAAYKGITFNQIVQILIEMASYDH